MSPPKIPPVVTDIELLNTPFKEIVKQLVADIEENKLPMRVFETLRPLARQRWLFDKGYSRASGPNGPHCWGLACDIILDERSPHWKDIGERPLAVDGGGAAWDTGYQRDGTGRIVLMRRGVAHVVREFGALALARGLTWGGVNVGAWASSSPGAEFGWDPFHVQLRQWRNLTRHLPPPK